MSQQSLSRSASTKIPTPLSANLLRQAKWRATHFGMKELDDLMESFSREIEAEAHTDEKLASDFVLLSCSDTSDIYAKIFITPPSPEEITNSALVRLLQYTHDQLAQVLH
eukprot:Gregarina_sp_Poly_1__14@NODE_1002_length_5406_cov_137_430043_g703_i0_p7_GENE_NODE_1002_length_5406_cov_137_430043_g703_i0NODE_1002_length_5406_cov_137_430043_g703_i0_p7_ORF_typecomplete_len110_score24_86Sdh5/PF03937_16/5_8e06_NODE_1002_length_5406_cov_137_430043_g703_i09511280